jgi:hypothetical protein
MGDITIIDYRRTDQRTTILENPFWLTSGLVSAVAADDLGAVVFSFPTASRIIVIHEVLVQNFQVLDTGVTVSIGSGTLATNAVTTGGVLTEVDRDEFVTTADVVLTANTVWGPTTANTSDWLTAKAAGTYAAPRFLVGAATAVPCIYAYTEKTGTIATGTFRVHVLVTILPGT